MIPTLIQSDVSRSSKWSLGACLAYLVAMLAQQPAVLATSGLKALLQISKTHSKIHPDQMRITTGYTRLVLFRLLISCLERLPEPLC